MTLHTAERSSYPCFDSTWIPRHDTSILLFDIETDGLLDSLSKVHCICALSLPDGKSYSFGPDAIDKGLALLAQAPLLCAHNGLCFDLPALKKLYPELKLSRCFDTLTASRLIWTNIHELDMANLRSTKGKGYQLHQRLVGSHSLEAWGERLGANKDDFGKHNGWEEWTPAMQAYCEQDVRTLHALYRHIIKENYSPEALALEHEFQEVIFKQEQAGVPFNTEAATRLYVALCAKRNELKERLQEAFPPLMIEETFIPKASNRKLGYVKGEPFTKRHTVAFNPSSRAMIAERLMKERNWQPSEFTESGQPKVDEEVLKLLPWPECKLLLEYLEIAKVIGMLSEGNHSWLKLVDESRRIHGRVITCGAVTGRCTHSNPNLAQIPAHGTYGKECRSLFTAGGKGGKVMVGADASGLELRMLASFLAHYDNGRYIEEILNGDIHTANQKAAGLATRDNAKTFIYAFLYGAGDAKLGEIVAPGTSEANQRKVGATLKARFFKSMPAVKRLLDAVQGTVGKRPFLYGIDRRKLHVRSKHSALNTLLQSAGAVLVKFATVIFHKEAERRYGWKQNVDYEQVLHVHDECQLICSRDKADALGSLFVEAMELAGKHFGLACPVTGEYKHGSNWSETH